MEIEGERRRWWWRERVFYKGRFCFFHIVNFCLKKCYSLISFSLFNFCKVTTFLLFCVLRGICGYTWHTFGVQIIIKNETFCDIRI